MKVEVDAGHLLDLIRSFVRNTNHLGPVTFEKHGKLFDAYSEVEEYVSRFGCKAELHESNDKRKNAMALAINTKTKIGKALAKAFDLKTKGKK